MEEQWIKKIQQKLESYEAEAPDGLYDDIQAEMARRGVVPVASGQRKSRAEHVRMWRVVGVAASVAAVVLIAVFPGRFLPEEPSPTASLPVPGKQMSHAAERPLPPSSAEETVTERLVSGMRRLAPDIREYSVSAGNLAVATRPAPSANTAAPSAATVEKELENKAAASDENPVRREEEPVTGKKETWRSRSLYGDMHDVAGIGSGGGGGSGRLGIDAYVRGATVGGSGSNAPVAMRHYLSMSDQVFGDRNMLGESSRKPSVKQPGHVRTHHSLPVKAGVSLRYHINDKWSVQTGVSYSYHSSDMEYDNENTRQQLHFVGIPVAASYSIWRNKRFNVYAAAGGEVEKMVKGRRTIDNMGYQREEKLKMSQLQVSTTLAVGAELMVVPAVGLFVEPGAVYHFDNGSGINTVYKDNPLDFSLSVGARINFNK